MRTLFSIIFQQFDMVIKVPLVAFLAAGIILITTKFGIGNRKTRYALGILLAAVFLVTMIAGLVLLTKPAGILLLEICILSFVASIIAFATAYLIDLNHHELKRSRKVNFPKLQRKALKDKE